MDRLNRVGPRHCEALHAIGIDSVLDLLTHYPRRYIDRTNQADIADLVDGQEAMVLATVRRSSARRTRQGRALVEVVLFDGSSYLSVTFFNQPWRHQAAERRHPGRGVRQGGALPGPAPDDESGGRPGRGPHRPDRPGVRAVGEGGREQLGDR